MDLRDFSRFTPRQKEIAADAYIERMAGDVANRPVSLLNKFKSSDAFKEEIRTMLGPQRAAEIEDWVRVEALMERGRQAVLGGSGTSRFAQQAKQWAGSLGTGLGGGAFIAGEYDPRNLVSSPAAYVGLFLGGLGSTRLTGQNAKIMRQVANRLVSGDPDEYKNALQQIATMPALRRILHEVTDPLIPSSATLGRVTGTFAGEQRGRPE